ncbi:MAG: FIST C-terminal domain-containing protein [Selenomonadaceae bacterium]|nr:FIST C-terminal domain-containing protein [Selenomonadaceae bacterium]
MIRVKKGQEESLERSLEVVAESVESPQMLLFYSRPGTLEQAAAFFADRFPDIPTLGICSTSVVCNGVVDEPDILLMSFDDEYRIACGLIRDLSQCPVQHVFQFQKDVESVGAGDEDTVCLEYCTGNEEMLVTTLNAVLDKYDIPMVGSTVFEGLERMGKGEVACCGDIFMDACIYAVIRCNRGKVRTYYENIYMRTELTVHQVTKVDVDKRSIIEIDGRPAADVYCDVVQVPRESIVEMNQRYPFGRVLGTRIFVADVAKVMPDGSLCCNKRLNPNDAICFMDYGRYQEVARETIERVQQENKNIYFTITGDCIHRFWLYQSDKFLERHANNLRRLGEHAGNICGGEQYHHQHINQSMVMIVFSYDTGEEGIA